MRLPGSQSSAKPPLGSAVLGRLLGTSDNSREPEESLPQLKFKLGEEPHTPRAGSPGFQDGHWVIARPKLATPTIYQHARSPTNDHSSLGLGATTPPTTTRKPRKSRGKSRNCRSSSYAWAAGEDSGVWEQDAQGRGGYTGTIHLWEAAEASYGGEQHRLIMNGGQVNKDEHDHSEVVDGKESNWENQAPRNTQGVVDNPKLDNVQPYVNDLYYAVAHPRFVADPVCLRRQRESACAAAGALNNILGRADRRINQPPRPTDKVGQERAEELELGARMLVRSLHEEFPASMRTRTAAALHKVLTFQDVRTRVGDVAPSIVAPLVRLLRQDGSSDKGRRAARDGEQEAAVTRSPEKVSREGELRQVRGRPEGGQSNERPRAGWVVNNSEGDEVGRHDGHKGKAPLHAAACLRVLALCEGLPEVLCSASAIPALVDGLKSGSPLMRSISGGCLASMAPCDEECCSEMIDFGLLPPLMDLVRDSNPLLEVTAWGLLAAIMNAREARQAFVRSDGLENLERMLVRRRSRKTSKRFLLAGQENAMRVLLRLCEDREQEQEKGDSQATDRTIPSILLLDDDNDNSAEDKRQESSSHDGAYNSSAPHHGEAKRGRREGGRGEPDDNARSFPSPQSSTPEGGYELGTFVAKECVFQAVLRQMRVGTSVSKETAARVLKLTWNACSRRQVDLTMPPVLQMLESNVWMLKSAAAQVILHVYVEDDQRLRCAVSGAVQSLIGTVRTRAPQMQAGTLSALLSLSEHPDVPAVIAEAGGLSVLADYLTTAKDVAARYIVLAIMKVILVCERPAVEPFLPDMLVSEHVLGASDDIDEFVRAFVEKRKASDYLRVGAANACRFAASDIAEYKETFKKLDKDASGALDERELGVLLKRLKVDSRKKTVKKVLVAVDKNNSGMIEFDEFLDIMWDVKHAKGASRGLLFSRAGVLLEGTLAAAQASLLSRPQQMRTPLRGASGLGGIFSHGHDAEGDGKSIASHATNSMVSSTLSGEQREEQEQPKQKKVVAQERQLAMTTTKFSAAMIRGKEVALSVLPKLPGKSMSWRGFSRTL